MFFDSFQIIFKMFIEDFMGLHPLKMSILTANVSCSRPSGIYYSTSGSWMHFIMGLWFGVLMALYGGYIRVFFSYSADYPEK